MTKIRLLILISLCLFFSLEGKAQGYHTMRPDSILYGRIQEYISLLSDYMGFMNDSRKPFNTKLYYKKKTLALFMPHAKAVIKGKNLKECQALSIKDFLDDVLDSTQDARQYVLDSIQVPNWKNKNLSSSDSILWTDSRIVKVHKQVSFNSSDSILLIRETTEMGDEWRPLLGSLFLSYKQLKINEDENKQDIIIPTLVADSTDNKSSNRQRPQQEHVRCKGETRGRVLQSIQRNGNKKRHSENRQGCKEEESLDATQPCQLQVYECSKDACCRYHDATGH